MDTIKLGEIEIKVTRKRIRNMHLRVLPPDGKVVVSAPYLLSSKSIERFVLSKADWINRNRERILSANPLPRPEYRSGEIHFLFGNPCILELVENGKPGTAFRQGNKIIMQTGAVDANAGERLMEKLYRDELAAIIPSIIEKWEPVKTRWGSCNTRSARIWLNLDLARRPFHLVEYIVVHEMTHLLERGHNAIFYAYMDKWIPSWKEYRKELRNSRL